VPPGEPTPAPAPPAAAQDDPAVTPARPSDLPTQ
jgi:hypothetical protein